MSVDLYSEWHLGRVGQWALERESNFDLVIFKRKRKRIPLSSSKNNKFVVRARCLMLGEAFCLVDEKFE